MRGSGSIRTLKKGTEDFIAILSSYDRFGSSRQTLTAVTNLMLAVSLITLAWVALTYPPQINPTDLPRARTVLLLIFFFGFSAMLFAFFRAILFLIHALMERAVGPVNGLPRKIAGKRKRGDVQGAVDTALATLNSSFMIWWKARKMIIAGAFLIIPALAFYLLGVSLLVIFILRSVFATP
jgi:hypothetical protein